jgi:hypothetical protein
LSFQSLKRGKTFGEYEFIENGVESLECSHSLPGDCPCRLSSNGMLFSSASLGADFDVGLFAGDWPCRLPTDVAPDFRVSLEVAFDGLFAGDWPCRLPTDVAPDP